MKHFFREAQLLAQRSRVLFVHFTLGVRCRSGLDNPHFKHVIIIDVGVMGRGVRGQSRGNDEYEIIRM